MRQYQTFELEFTGEEPEVSNTVIDLYGEFSCEGKTVTVPGFYDGNGVYKIRFLPQKTGSYFWKVSGLFQAEGREECLDQKDGIHHGLAKPEGTAIRFEDGKPCRPFGTTVYALVHQPKELIEQTIKTILDSPFDKVRLCIFPKHYIYNQNEPEDFPFEKDGTGKFDYHRPYFPFWKRLESIIETFGEHQIQADLILFHPYDCWGFSEMNRTQYTVYLDYLLRRLPAFPNIWWSLANEYDSMHHFHEEDWEFIDTYIQSHDPYGHMLSCHFMLKPYDFSRAAVTHCSAQGDEVGEVMKWRARYQKPVFYDEFGYEGNLRYQWGNLSGFEMVDRCWQICTRGGYLSHGEAFWNPQEILWWSKGGTLAGEAPARIGFLKEIINELPEALEPIDTAHMNPEKLEEIRNGVNQDMLDDYTRALMRLPAEQAYQVIDRMEKSAAIFAGRCGKEAYLYYYGRRCTREAVLDLADDAEYQVDVIDVWEMTRTTVMSGAHGTTGVILPGKEGIAVLAQKTVDIYQEN